MNNGKGSRIFTPAMSAKDLLNTPPEIIFQKKEISLQVHELNRDMPYHRKLKSRSRLDIKENLYRNSTHLIPKAASTN